MSLVIYRQSNQPERGSSIHTKGPFKLTRNKSEYCDEKCSHVKNKLKAVRIVLLMMELIIKDNWLTTYTHTYIYMYWYKGMGYTTTGSIHQLFICYTQYSESALFNAHILVIILYKGHPANYLNLNFFFKSAPYALSNKS